MWKLLIPGALALGIAAAGCATEIVEVPLPADHPASASAAPAPRPPASTTLHGGHEASPRQENGQSTAPRGAHDAHAAHGQSAATPTTVQAAAPYVCPMHPEVTRATPGTCPKCEMKLVPKGTPNGPHEGHH